MNDLEGHSRSPEMVPFGIPCITFYKWSQWSVSILHRFRAALALLRDVWWPVLIPTDFLLQILSHLLAAMYNFLQSPIHARWVKVCMRTAIGAFPLVPYDSIGNGNKIVAPSRNWMEMEINVMEMGVVFSHWHFFLHHIISSCTFLWHGLILDI